jgi:hypothetical protein
MWTRRNRHPGPPHQPADDAMREDLVEAQQTYEQYAALAERARIARNGVIAGGARGKGVAP